MIPSGKEAAERLAHIERNLRFYESDVPSRVAAIRARSGSVVNRMGLLAYYPVAEAMWAWFKHQDLDKLRHWLFAAAVLDAEVNILEADTLNPGVTMSQAMNPLLSNHQPSIRRYMQQEFKFDPNRIGNPKTWDFLAYQIMIALRGEWDLLAMRCETRLASPPRSGRASYYMADHQFYLALAQADVPGMLEALRTITSPRLHRLRDQGGAYTDGLISTPAVIYAKLAWYHGHELAIDDPYIPAAWLPMTPLAHYEFPFDIPVHVPR